MFAFRINPMITWIALYEYCSNDLKELRDFLRTLIYAMELGTRAGWTQYEYF